MKLAPVHFGQVVRTTVASATENAIEPAIAPYTHGADVPAVFIKSLEGGKAQLTILSEDDRLVPQQAVADFNTARNNHKPLSGWIKQVAELTGVRNGRDLANWYNDQFSVADIEKVHEQLLPGLAEMLKPATQDA